MPEHTIQVSRLTRKLRSIWGLRGEDYPTQAEDVRGYICLEQERPEWLVPGGELPFSTSIVNPALAANFGSLSIFNATKGLQVVIERYCLSEASGATSLLLAWITADTALAVSTIFTRDSRTGDPTQGTFGGLSVRSANNAALLGTIFHATPNAVWGETPHIVNVGAGIVFQNGTVNNASRITISGRIRVLEAGVNS